ncbi:MAG: primosomal protein N' [Oscillospiraceae bacterium]|jgi:primosomal protein N' (replication factor Y)|nr:primosomal protein N' [Oscillospiraceae bacterium]
MPNLIAKVAVEKVKFYFDIDFSYLIPENIQNEIKVGSRIFVPFGRSNKKLRAFVLELIDKKSEDRKNLKEAYGLIDQEPILTEKFLKFSKWISQKYFCSIYDACVKCVFLARTGEISQEFQKNNNSKKITVDISELSSDQKKSYEKLSKWLNTKSKTSALLYGITGSGKTKVYLELAALALSQGKKVLCMIPEIALVSQILNKFEKRFGKDQIALFHSGLTTSQRRIEWQKVKSGIANIAIGTRSAVFAPFNKIGLAIIDEEQEPTYKSDSSPRFHAREAAYFLCKYDGGKLLLASATPSIETFYAAQQGNIYLSVLNKRYGEAKLAIPEIIDANHVSMSSELISLRLINMIIENIKIGKQAILLLDRRGFHTLVRCASCGHVLMCPNCSITLSLHFDSEKNQICRCHYCCFSCNAPKICPMCGSDKIRTTGLGTQKLEDEINKFIPEARCLRVDADTTSKKSCYKKMFGDFKKGLYNIMLGTRMVAKGLDFKNVNLIGVLCADHALFGESYKSYEHAFSLISQVAGRSGRNSELDQSVAIIQTFSPQNPIIRLAAKQDYYTFFNNEIILRKKLLYPPFSDICIIGFMGKNESKTVSACIFLCEILKFEARNFYPDLPLRVLAPTPALIKKAFSKFRYKIILKCRNDVKFRDFIINVIHKYEKLKQIGATKILPGTKNKVSIFIDINPEMIF